MRQMFPVAMVDETAMRTSQRDGMWRKVSVTESKRLGDAVQKAAKEGWRLDQTLIAWYSPSRDNSPS